MLICRRESPKPLVATAYKKPIGLYVLSQIPTPNGPGDPDVVGNSTHPMFRLYLSLPLDETGYRQYYNSAWSKELASMPASPTARRVCGRSIDESRQRRAAHEASRLACALSIAISWPVGQGIFALSGMRAAKAHGGLLDHRPCFVHPEATIQHGYDPVVRD